MDFIYSCLLLGKYNFNKLIIMTPNYTLADHIQTMVNTANEAGIKTYLYPSYDKMYDINEEFIDIE
jgi:hypothetical protein